MTPPTQVRRPVAVTVAIVLVYIGGLLNTALGVLVLLSRYEVSADLVLPVSLIGAATILLGLLTVAGGSALSRGSRLAPNARPAFVNGAAGAVVWSRGRPVAAVGFQIVGGRSAGIDGDADPGKLPPLG